MIYYLDIYNLLFICKSYYLIILKYSTTVTNYPTHAWGARGGP